MELLNGGKATCTFTVQADYYREDGPWTVTVEPARKESLSWDLRQSGRWYDFSLRCDSDPSFYRRFAGRVETGEHGVSDPALGLVDF